jgi:hypothetical protein
VSFDLLSIEISHITLGKELTPIFPLELEISLRMAMFAIITGVFLFLFL